MQGTWIKLNSYTNLQHIMNYKHKFEYQNFVNYYSLIRDKVTEAYA
jgi:hypothetical protein